MNRSKTTNPRSSRDQHRIDTIICLIFNIKVSELHSDSTKRKIVDARMTAMYLQKELLGKSFPRIAKYFNKKSHSTVINAYQTISGYIQTDPALNKKITLCIKRFSAYTLDKTKQKYNLHSSLRKQGIQVSSQTQTIYMPPERYNDLIGRKKLHVTKLMKLHNYSLQLIID